MTQTKYPVETVSIVRKTRTFAINSFLTKADGYNEESPYKLFGKFSRFAFSILDSSDGVKKTATANIRPSEMPAIVAKTNIALKQNVLYTPSEAVTEANDSPAYTVTFGMGSLKGKTPAQVILEGKGKELMQQRNFLLENLNKYPKNRKIVEAIDDAVKLYKENKLERKEKGKTETKELVIYKAGMHPLIRNTREDGKCKVYDMTIAWKLGADYPVNLTIMNYYASVIKMEDGRLNVRNVDNSSKLTLNIAMTDVEWMNVIESLQRNMRMFEVINAKSLFEQADQIYRQSIAQRRPGFAG